MTARSRRVRGAAGKDAGGRRTPCGAVTTRTQPAAFLAGEAARSIRRRTTSVLRQRFVKYFLRLSRMSSAVRCHTNGRGLSFQAPIQALRAVVSSLTERWAERRSIRLVSSANQRSTRFSHDELVGVKWNVKRGWRRSQVLMAGVL